MNHAQVEVTYPDTKIDAGVPGHMEIVKHDLIYYFFDGINVYGVTFTLQDSIRLEEKPLLHNFMPGFSLGEFLSF